MKDKKIFCFWECEYYSYPEWKIHGCYVWGDDRGMGLDIPVQDVTLVFIGSDQCKTKVALSVAHHNCPYKEQLISAQDAINRDDEV